MIHPLLLLPKWTLISEPSLPYDQCQPLLWVGILPQSELDKIQEAPRHCDQRNSAFPPGAGGELRKQPEVCLSPPLLPWPEFYLCPPLPAGTGEPGYTQPGTPLQDSHPQRLSGINQLLLPSEPDCSQGGSEEEMVLSSPVLMGAGSPTLYWSLAHWPSHEGQRPMGRHPAPGSCLRFLPQGTWCNPVWAWKAKWSFSHYTLNPRPWPLFLPPTRATEDGARVKTRIRKTRHFCV